MQLPQKEGLYVWKTMAPDQTSWASQIVRDTLAANISDLYIKVANGVYQYNDQDGGTSLEYIFSSLADEGVRLWGWHYVFLDFPTKEAEAAAKAIERWNLHGMVINAEGHAKNKNTNARIMVDELRERIGSDIPLGLSSYRYPNYHPELPWKQFLSRVDFNQPQVYWVGAHNAVEQLDLTIKRTRAHEMQLGLEPTPIHPLLCAYSDDPQEWKPKETSMIDVFNHAKEIGLPSAAWYQWKASKAIGRWDVIETYTDWEEQQPNPPDDTPYTAEDLEQARLEGYVDGWNESLDAAIDKQFGGLRKG